MNDLVRKGAVREISEVKDVFDVEGLTNLLFNDGLVFGKNLGGAAADHAKT